MLKSQYSLLSEIKEVSDFAAASIFQKGTEAERL